MRTVNFRFKNSSSNHLCSTLLGSIFKRHILYCISPRSIKIQADQFIAIHPPQGISIPDYYASILSKCIQSICSAFVHARAVRNNNRGVFTQINTVEITHINFRDMHIKSLIKQMPNLSSIISVDTSSNKHRNFWLSNGSEVIAS